MTILILSAERDVHAVAVISALRDCGAGFELLDLSSYPTGRALRMEYAGRRHRFALSREDGSVLDLDAVRAVWWRRPQPFGLPDAMTDEATRAFTLAEIRSTFRGLYQSLDAMWVNPPDRDDFAEHKPYQLTLAQELGLSIPPTLITNDPQAAAGFWAAHPEGVIHKQICGVKGLWRETRLVSEADAAVLETVAHAPVLFQGYIDAVAELRVTIIGGEMFAARAELGELAYPQDIRVNAATRYVPAELPAEVRARLLALMRRLGLVYGAIDLRLTEAGDHVFLEINPAGQFLYIEEQTGQPIAAALARCLAQAGG